MGTRIIALILLCSVSAFAQAPVISPSTAPSVNASQTQQFTATNGPITWTCPGCAGSISAGGLYTAPATIHSQQSYGGFQLLPNDHIYNTRIDSLPVASYSATLITGSGTTALGMENAAFPINYCTSVTCPAQTITFFDTPLNGGSFEIPVYPQAKIESGWLSALSGVGSIDHHLWDIDTATGNFVELYQYVPNGNVGGCGACNSDAGVQYLQSTYNLASNNYSSDAAGLYIMPLVDKLQEYQNAVAGNCPTVDAACLKHAIRFTLNNNHICDSGIANACGANAGGTRHIWPATAEAFAGGGVVPYGARYRLKSTFNCTSYSQIMQIFCTQLKEYGMILADGGNDFQTQLEHTYWPAAYVNAFNPIGGELGTVNLTPSNFEVVDESGLMLSTTSGATTSSETVVATAAGGTAKQQVVLTGVTVNLASDALYMQAGVSSQQIVAYVHGSANTALTWTLGAGSVGSINSSTGVYNPPATVASTTRFTVTATSNADGSVSATGTITIYPTGVIYQILGQSSPYTDTNGHVWAPEMADDLGNFCIYAGDPGPWSGTDILLYEVRCQAGDVYFTVSLPNGVYQITDLCAESDPSVTMAGQRLFDIEAQGNILVTNFDIFATAGGAHLPVNESVTATVSNGTLNYVLRYINTKGTRIASIRITQLSPVVPAAPPKAGLLLSAEGGR